MNVDDMCGKFEGKGRWYDSAGNDGAYDIVQTNTRREEGFEIRQKHIHDGTGSEMDIVLKRVAPYIYSVEATEADGGYGFMVDDVLRFYLNNHLQTITEIGYQLRKPGMLSVYGSCTKNSAGNYIMWHEELHRVADTT